MLTRERATRGVLAERRRADRDTTATELRVGVEEPCRERIESSVHHDEGVRHGEPELTEEREAFRLSAHRGVSDCVDRDAARFAHGGSISRARRLMKRRECRDEGVHGTPCGAHERLFLARGNSVSSVPCVQSSSLLGSDSFRPSSPACPPPARVVARTLRVRPLRPPATARPVEVAPFDGEGFLVTYARSHHALPARPEGTVADLEARRRATRRGDDKRPITRDLALIHLAEADAATDEAVARTELEAADREAKAALRGNRDPAIADACTFVALWAEFRLHAPTASAAAQAYVQTHTTSNETTRVAWMARGEIALGASDWATARDSFRYVMGDFSSPLYGYALSRTAVAYQGEGRNDEAHDSLRFVIRDGLCAERRARERRDGRACVGLARATDRRGRSRRSRASVLRAAAGARNRASLSTIRVCVAASPERRRERRITRADAAIRWTRSPDGS